MGNWGVFALIAITIIVVGLVILGAIGLAAMPKSDSGSGSSVTPVWVMPWWPSRDTPMLGPGGERRYGPETPNLGPGGERHLLGPGGTFRYGKESFADSVAPMPVPYSATGVFSGSSEPSMLGKGDKEGFENFASF